MIDFTELPSGLLIARTPITQAQWQEVMGTDPSYFKGDDRPVECVSWHDAMEFCRKTGTRLPTDEEWEYAYRAGTTTTWYNGDDESKVGDIAWVFENSAGQTRPVAQKQPNAWGLYDMAGNVWEWCADSADSYREFLDDVGFRVVKGGSWINDSSSMQAAGRFSLYPDDYDLNIGFRVVKGGPWVSDASDTQASGRDKNKPERRLDIIGFRVVKGADK